MAGLTSSVVVTSIAAGMRHSALITRMCCSQTLNPQRSLTLTFQCAPPEQGHLLTMGQGRFGELGHGDLLSRAVPTMVDKLAASHRVARVVCGQKHTVCLTGTGKRPCLARSTLGLALTHVHGTDEGSVFAWGDNTHGQLGIGHLGLTAASDLSTTVAQTAVTSPPQSTSEPARVASRSHRGTRHRRIESCCPVPQPVDIPDKVSTIACGWSFTLVVTGTLRTLSHHGNALLIARSSTQRQASMVSEGTTTGNWALATPSTDHDRRSFRPRAGTVLQ
jgi:alpha-tubulin suppressor-like RCC1 family protein